MESSTSISPLERRALVLLIRAIFDQVDEIAALRKRGKPANVSMIVLQEMTSVLKDLDSRLMDAYLEMLPVLCPTESRHIVQEVDEAMPAYLASPRKKLIQEIRVDLKLKAA